MFDRSAFAYRPETDAYVCPAGRAVAREQLMRRDSIVLYASSDCSACSFKFNCTVAERRFVTRHKHEEALERTNARVEGDPSLMKTRRCAAEHPFGTIKRMIAGGRVLTRGLKRSPAKPPSACWPTTSTRRSTSPGRDPARKARLRRRPLSFSRSLPPAAFETTNWTRSKQRSGRRCDL